MLNGVGGGVGHHANQPSHHNLGGVGGAQHHMHHTAAMNGHHTNGGSIITSNTASLASKPILSHHSTTSHLNSNHVTSNSNHHHNHHNGIPNGTSSSTNGHHTNGHYTNGANSHSNSSSSSNSNGSSSVNGSTGSSSNGSSANTTTTTTTTTTNNGSSTNGSSSSTTTNNTSVSSTSNANNSLIVASSKALMLTNGNGLYKVFSTESVLNLLHCLYCKKPYRDPRLLQCGHTYCLPCLVQMNRYSTIRCIKCNSLHTITSHNVDTLPKNLFVADIQCIPTVEIDRGAAYKETLKSLEDLKAKLLDFSDKFDQSEEKLVNLAEMKKIEVSQHISKVIDQIRQLEDEFHNEIEEFKNNRLAVLRSAPPEFKETNANLLQFVNQSLDDLMRPDIKEEDVKEIYNRCEEHRRLWNETEIIFNSNYAIGEVSFAVNDQAISKEIVGSVVQKLPQKLNAQRTAKGPISISECCVDGDYIVIENTSKRHDVNMTNWLLTHCVGSVRKISFKFPDQFILKSRQSVKMWAAASRSSGGHSPTGNGTTKFNGVSNNSSQNSSSSSLLSKSPNTNGNGFYLNGHHTSKESLLVSTTTPTANNQQTSSSPPALGGGSNGTSSTNDMNYTDSIENELIIYDIENWICGAQEIFIRLENEFGEEKASFRKTN